MWNVVICTGIVYVIYLQLGAALFMFLESIKELNIGEVEVVNANESLNFSDLRFILVHEGFTDEDVDSTIRHWQKDTYSKYFSTGEVSPELGSWTYSNAFFFAFHLCSTIGYGDISPKTSWGQIVVIVYAILGIPIHIIFFKFFGESFTRAYEETIWTIKGKDDSKRKRLLADFGFFVPWTLILFIIPSIVFTFTENWNFIEGVYYSFITLSTVGLGDYVAGNKVEKVTTYFLYKVAILTWMLYGLAFTQMILTTVTHLYQANLLFGFKSSPKKCRCSIHRVFVEIEKLDIHFRIMREGGVKHQFNILAKRKDTKETRNFKIEHLGNLAVLAERTQERITKLLSRPSGSDES